MDVRVFLDSPETLRRDPTADDVTSPCPRLLWKGPWVDRDPVSDECYTLTYRVPGTVFSADNPTNPDLMLCLPCL